MTTILYALRFSGDVAKTLAQYQMELFRAFGLVSALALPPLIQLLTVSADNRTTGAPQHVLDAIRRRHPTTVQAQDFVVPSQRLVGARCDAIGVAQLGATLADTIGGAIEQQRAIAPQLVLAWEHHPVASCSAVGSITKAIPTTGALWLTRFIIHSDAGDWARDCDWQVEYSRRLGPTRRRHSSDRRS